LNYISIEAKEIFIATVHFSTGLK